MNYKKQNVNGIIRIVEKLTVPSVVKRYKTQNKRMREEIKDLRKKLEDEERDVQYKLLLDDLVQRKLLEFIEALNGYGFSRNVIKALKKEYGNYTHDFVPYLKMKIEEEKK